MQTKSIKTKLFQPPQDDLYITLKKSFKRLPEKSVVVIASKVVSIHQGRCVLKSDVDKEELIKKEADRYLPRNKIPKDAVVLTIKNNILIPTAGIDSSNSGEYYILWPKQPQRIAKEIWQFLRKTYKIKKLGVIISDSHTVPMRRGVMGIAVSYYGFEPVNDYRGTKDLFNRKFEMSTVDVADSLATAGMVVMGEGREQTPIAIVTEVPFVGFSNKPSLSLKMTPQEDLYRPLLKAIKWKK